MNLFLSAQMKLKFIGYSENSTHYIEKIYSALYGRISKIIRFDEIFGSISFDFYETRHIYSYDSRLQTEQTLSYPSGGNFCLKILSAHLFSLSRLLN